MTQPFKVWATGQRRSKTEIARSASSRLPLGIFTWYLTRRSVSFRTPSGALTVPSASVQSLSGWLGIPRASSAPARVPVSQPAADATR